MGTLSKEERDAQIARDGARAQGKIIVDTWLADHKEDFQPSDAHSKMIGDWLMSHGRGFSYEALDEALADFKSRGVSFAAPKGPRVDWARRHSADFDNSVESWAKIDTYLKTYRMTDIDQGNLEQAFQAIRGAKGPKAFMSSSSATAESTGELPWIPGHIQQFKTKKELDTMISHEDFKKYYFGPDAAAFRARCVAVNNKRG